MAYGITFSWDDDKQIANIKKHGVSFSEATSVFDDENALYLPDERHSEKEDRFIVIGISEKLNTLMVCHCYRKDGAEIRIISARKASKTESARYGR